MELVCISHVSPTDLWTFTKSVFTTLVMRQKELFYKADSRVWQIIEINMHSFILSQKVMLQVTAFWRKKKK